MRRLHREPLIHFLLLGAALFGLHAALNRDTPTSADEIIVSAGHVENLAAVFARVWQRPPTGPEIKGLVDQYVKEEILSREAMRLGLDQDDTVIRRRLQQKMEFLAEDFAAAFEPTEAELAEYFASHPEQFGEVERFTFLQVFLSPERRGDRLEADTLKLLADLKEGGADVDVTELGDALLLPREFIDEPLSAVAAEFGKEFADELAKLKTRDWTGPIRSAYGLHLVFVSHRSEVRMPELQEVRETVRREIVNTRRGQANERFLESLLKKYRVTIEWPKSESSSLVGAEVAVNP